MQNSLPHNRNDIAKGTPKISCGMISFPPGRKRLHYKPIHGIHSSNMKRVINRINKNLNVDIHLRAWLEKECVRRYIEVLPCWHAAPLSIRPSCHLWTHQFPVSKARIQKRAKTKRENQAASLHPPRCRPRQRLGERAEIIFICARNTASPKRSSGHI